MFDLGEYNEGKFEDFMARVYPDVRNGSSRWRGYHDAFFAGMVTVAVRLGDQTLSLEERVRVINEIGAISNNLISAYITRRSGSG